MRNGTQWAGSETQTQMILLQDSVSEQCPFGTRWWSGAQSQPLGYGDKFHSYMANCWHAFLTHKRLPNQEKRSAIPVKNWHQWHWVVNAQPDMTARGRSEVSWSDKEHRKGLLKAFWLLSSLPRMKHLRAHIILGDLELMKSAVAGNTDSACGHLLLSTCPDASRRKTGLSKGLIILLWGSLHR